MSADLWIGAAAAVVGIIGAIIGYTKFWAQAPLVVEKAKAEAAYAEEKRRSDLDRDRLAELDARYTNLQQDFLNLQRGKTDVILKHEIDTDLRKAAEALGVIESSVLVPGAPPNASSFVFLSINGPAAAKLRLTKLRIDSGIVGRVFETGRLHNTSNAYDDPNFFPGIDKKGKHETQTLLTIPLRHNAEIVGVAQFLNKPEGFSANDETMATEFAVRLAPKVADFARNPENFELLGLAGEIEDKEATIAFCDLTSSSSLLLHMNTANAVDCINEYLEQQCEVAMRHGATVDKYIGDGAMIRFVASRSRGGDHIVSAVDAALEMQEGFERLKAGWVSSGLPVRDIFNRIGLSCGTVHDAKLGHPQRQEITVIGEAVNEAANLCETARRTGDVVVAPGHLVARLDGLFVAKATKSKPKRLNPHEILGRAS